MGLYRWGLCIETLSQKRRGRGEGGGKRREEGEEEEEEERKSDAYLMQEYSTLFNSPPYPLSSEIL